ncbi:MAG: glycosyltransferase [Nitrosarchaeum sp.]|nr:glycosyltransferase [Nitrosarchaeum sp.]
MVDIYITSFFRQQMTERTISLLQERTTPGTYQLHVFDNGSDKSTQDYLYSLLENKTIASLHLDSRNTGCLYNKAIFHAMTASTQPYYVITDNDIYPPKLSPDWLQQMTAIMEMYPGLACLTPQCATSAMHTMPELIHPTVVFCKVAGNALKLMRRAAFPVNQYHQKLNAFGDDGQLSELIRNNGWHIGFCRQVFFLHAGQCENWGYEANEIDNDPRKATYGPPLIVPVINEETWEPADPKYKL